LDGVDQENEEKVTEKWERYLRDNLELPFKAKILELEKYTFGLNVET